MPIPILFLQDEIAPILSWTYLPAKLLKPATSNNNLGDAS